MKKIIIALVLLISVIVSILFYFGLSTNSFEGRVSEVDENGQLIVDCPVPKLGSNVDDMAYLCKVQTTENTIINNNNGEILSLADIELGDSISVVLTKRYFIGKDKSSREVKAEEITVLH
ncbi:hypothetical protein [Virgibacillus litoralis]|uniref:DUF3221 domain-containing protein n=1 Tax=Virgibacillus litoralis TaxID=578221 RepID=A0ABS4HIL4_9BACI|nr:hypothetical protein [Virgibacillus litoralis]MBP1950769.1 hypothetical protein [Virgibacillus litoralis]